MKFMRLLSCASLLTVSIFAAELPASDSSRFQELYSASDDKPVALSSRYAHLENMQGKELFDALHRQTGQGYKTKGYKEAKQYMYDVVDNKGGKVFTAYSEIYADGKGRRYFEKGDQNKDGTSGDFVNCEHIWPQSKFNKVKPMVSDIHQLFSTFSKPNGMRGSWPFGYVKKARYSTSAGAKEGGSTFEPQDGLKGNVARAMLYFMVRYHDRYIFRNTDKHAFWNSRVKMFLKWNREDPPDEWETERNNRVEQYQGNRNPFIDEPALADKIGDKPFIQRYDYHGKRKYYQ